MLEGLLAVEACLGEELVGVAYQAFLDGLGEERLAGQGQLLRDDVVEGESCAGVSLAHACMPWVSFLAKEQGADAAVTDVWLCAVAADAWCVAAEYADVMEHGGLFHELAVDVQLGVTVGNAQGEVGHRTAVGEEYVAQLVVVSVVFVYD